MKKIMGRLALSPLQRHAITMNSSTVSVQAGTGRLFHAFLMAFLMVTLVGCKTAKVSSSLTSHPEAYRRVAILPICFTGSFPTDLAVPAENPEIARRQTGTQLAFALTNQLTRKGYQVIGPVNAVSEEQGWAGFDPAAGWILRQQFDLENIRTDRGETNILYRYGLISSLPLLQEKLQLPEADALVLLERLSGYESPSEQRKARKWNYAGGAFLVTLTVMGGQPDFELLGQVIDHDWNDGPLLYQSDSVDYVIYIFDCHTREVIFNRCQNFKYRNPASAMRVLLGSLPKCPVSGD
jgi:hypothetical protein